MTLQSVEFGEVKVVVPIPKKDEPWGVLAPLKETEWASSIPIVSGENFSHALHGWIVPLMREIGINPRLQARKIPPEQGICGLQECPIRGKYCYPNPKVPECYEAPIQDPEIRALVNTLVLAWKDNYYCVIVQGDEFTF